MRTPPHVDYPRQSGWNSAAMKIQAESPTMTSRRGKAIPQDAAREEPLSSSPPGNGNAKEEEACRKEKEVLGKWKRSEQYARATGAMDRAVVAGQRAFRADGQTFDGVSFD